jgi:hypothetical protein
MLKRSSSPPHARSTRRRPSRAQLVVLWIIVLACMPLSRAQRPRSDSTRFLVILNESETDISSTGINLSNCALISPEGRFHLERRAQQLPSHGATLKLFDSSLDSTQFRQLQEILNNESIKGLPPFVPPAPLMMGTRFRGFKATIARGEEVQSVGYFIEQGQAEEKSSHSPPSGMKRAWEQSEAALQPLLRWLHGLEASKLEPSDGKSTLCNADINE